MSEFFTPSQFYLHRVEFVDTMVRLEKDITDWVDEKQTASYNLKPKEGEIVVVKCMGETSFHRARVVKMLT